MSHRLVIAAVAALGLTAFAGVARAQVTVTVSGGTPTIASYYQIGHCLDVGNSNVIMYATCQSGRGAQGWRFVSGSYGMISLGNQTCLQSNGQGSPLSAAGCNNGQNQRWGIQANGELRNELGLCADIEGGNRASGARIVGWSCHGGMNQKWYTATSGGRATYRISSTTPLSGLQPGRALLASRGVSSSNIVAGGAGNIVAGGAGNIVAGGAGNIIAGGAGNIIAASILAGGAGNIVAGGAGNLIANDGASLRNIAPGGY
ncbi:ricin-type beta-trefoil lectin domain protein [Brevundimonas sp.]|jgi:hypothetical protein|uniref:ricin-type beta-trefoil lectin domain protein n=1 Tax=Brevundimonas sp. TaxID=1871086 RepID=UPI0037844A02